MKESKRSEEKRPPWAPDAGAEPVSFGLWLRQQREVREIGLREISDSSKISLRYLEALEQDRFDLLPASVFARGFLRQYARYVGLDQDEVVNYYLAARQAKGDELDDETDETDNEPRVQPFPWQLVAMIAAAAILLIALVSFLIYHFRSGEPEAADETTVGERAPAPVVPLSTDSGPSRSDQTTTDAAGGSGADSSGQAVKAAVAAERIVDENAAPVRVTVDFVEDCWVEASIDGRRQVSEMRVQGESLQLEAQRQVDLRLGNAEGVEIQLNGRRYELAAGSRQVRSLRFDLAAVEALIQSAQSVEGQDGGNGSGSAPATETISRP